MRWASALSRAGKTQKMKTSHLWERQDRPNVWCKRDQLFSAAYDAWTYMCTAVLHIVLDEMKPLQPWFLLRLQLHWLLLNCSCSRKVYDVRLLKTMHKQGGDWYISPEMQKLWPLLHSYSICDQWMPGTIHHNNDLYADQMHDFQALPHPSFCKSGPTYARIFLWKRVLTHNCLSEVRRKGKCRELVDQAYPWQIEVN